jgi:pimeloyl-ACP methyl ester carboxylesterase
VTGIVLVHGLCHGPWCWDKVVPLLQGDDVAIATPDLSKGPTDHSDVQTAVDHLAEHGPVVVCAHSFGGYAVTALDPTNITRMVLLAALLVDDREWFSDTPASPQFFEMATIDEAQVVTPKPECAAELFYADCSAADAKWAISNLVPASVKGMRDVMERPAWREVPTTYVQCSMDNVFTQKYASAALVHVGSGVCFPTSHSPMISRPDLVADLLNSIVADVRI